MTTPSIERTIEHIERLYESVTGREAPRSNGRRYAPIPPESDASEHIEQQFSRLLETVQSVLTPPPMTPWTPWVSIRKEGAEHIVEVELAGVEREAIELQLAGGMLIVRGTRDLPRLADPAEGVLYTERPHGRFERAIPLPERPTPGDLRAELRDGVLRVRVAMSNHTTTEPRNIAIT